MSLPVVFRPEAEHDLLMAHTWSEGQRLGLGDEFMEQVTAALERVADMPEMFATIWEDVRTCRSRRFPYVIYYRALADRVEVFAVLHGSRDPSTWRSRL
jgi:plasmid stabilization system protein ParE